LRDLWNSLDTERVPILDDGGVQMANAEIRRIDADRWLYVDDVDGFGIVDNAEADRLLR
jgi:hypothetical protein